MAKKWFPAACLMLLGGMGFANSLFAHPVIGRDGAEIVQRYCATCHEKGRMGAPRIGDKADWQKRLQAGGIDKLVVNARDGKGGMPPGGYCSNCSDNEFQAAIEWMMGQTSTH